MHKGILIAIEGTDGCGKSTLAKTMADHIAIYTKFPVKVLHFPLQESPHYDEIMKFLKDPKADPSKLQKCMYENIKYGLTNVWNWLQRDYVVILDRWILSNIVYSFCSNAYGHMATILNDSKPYNEEDSDDKTIDVANIHMKLWNQIWGMEATYPDIVLGINPSPEIVLKCLRNDDRGDKNDVNDKSEKVLQHLNAFNTMFYFNNFMCQRFFGYRTSCPHLVHIDLSKCSLDEEFFYWKQMESMSIDAVMKAIKDKQIDMKCKF